MLNILKQLHQFFCMFPGKMEQKVIFPNNMILVLQGFCEVFCSQLFCRLQWAPYISASCIITYKSKQDIQIMHITTYMTRTDRENSKPNQHFLCELPITKCLRHQSFLEALYLLAYFQSSFVSRYCLFSFVQILVLDLLPKYSDISSQDVDCIVIKIFLWIMKK